MRPFYVADASVLLKWLIPERPEEHFEQASALMAAFAEDKLDLLQPPHWLAEVSAVLARESADSAPEKIGLLHALEIPVSLGAEIYLTATRLSIRYGHHLFDTLYHAVAIEHRAVLVTADARYYRKVRSHGAIMALADFVVDPGSDTAPAP